MEHSLPLISTLVIAFSLALIFGFVAERFLKAPALVGYLLAVDCEASFFEKNGVG